MKRQGEEWMETGRHGDNFGDYIPVLLSKRRRLVTNRPAGMNGDMEGGARNVGGGGRE